MGKNCLDCKSKSCKAKGVDCFGVKENSLSFYGNNINEKIVKDSSSLIDNGRAGQLSRFQEVVEFCQLQGYKRVGLAYCFGLESLAQKVRDILVGQGVGIIPARCTMGGVKESDIDRDKQSDAISCNPAGQAQFLNEQSDFVIEMGLCLGHDVLFHQSLDIPFTVLLVKDRVHAHAPLEGILNFSMEGDS